MADSHVFIKIEDYRTIAEVIKATKEKIAKAHELLERLQELKHQEDEQLAAWSTELADVEKRIDDVDASLSEPEM